MKTMVDIPDGLYPVLASASEATGQSLAAFLIQAAREKAAGLEAKPPEAKFQEWWNSFQKSDPGVVAEVQRIIDEEFSNVRPEDWE